uniref:Ankyrin repeat protein n=1 Tax=Pithovirus LCPAC101 TaxID=2506586 RepID=A0A481Z4J5_9VIRU|nr:MAG: hypothetical protein LCPAC101_02120 [Pithovirus LCPAC101]
MEEYRNTIILEYVNIINSYIGKLVNTYKLKGDYTIKVESVTLLDEEGQSNEGKEVYEVTLVITYKNLINFSNKNKIWKQLNDRFYSQWDKVDIENNIYNSNINNLEIEIGGDDIFIIFDFTIMEEEEYIKLTDLPTEIIGEITKSMTQKTALSLCVATKFEKYNDIYCSDIFKTKLKKIYDYLIDGLPKNTSIDYPKLSEELLSKMFYSGNFSIYKFFDGYIDGGYPEIELNEMITILASFYSVDTDNVSNWDPDKDLLSELLRLLSLNPKTSNDILKSIQNILRNISTYNTNKHFAHIYITMGDIRSSIPYTYIHILTNPNINKHVFKSSKTKKVTVIPPNLEYLLKIYNPIDPSKEDVAEMMAVMKTLIQNRYSVDSISSFYYTINKYLSNENKNNILEYATKYGNLDIVKYLLSKIGIPDNANDKVKLIISALTNIKSLNSEYEPITMNDDIVNYLSNEFGYNDYKIEKFNLIDVARKSGDVIRYDYVDNKKITNKEFNDMIKSRNNRRNNNLVDVLLAYPDNTINKIILNSRIIIDNGNQGTMNALSLLNDNRVHPEQDNGKYIIGIAGGAGDDHVETKLKSVLISRSLQHPKVDPTEQNNKALKSAATKSRYYTINELKKYNRITNNAIYDAIVEAINKSKLTPIKNLLHGINIQTPKLNSLIEYAINKKKVKIVKYLQSLR